MHNEIWSIELDNGYELKDVGNLPNISAIAFADNKLFVASRTKSRIAIIDYDTFGLVSEFTNIISGHAVTTLSDYNLDISPPFCVMGHNHMIAWPKNYPVIAIPFVTSYGPFEVDVCFK